MLRDQVTEMVAELHAAPTADGFERVLAPGEPEYLRSRERSQDGIPIDENLWTELTALLPDGARSQASRCERKEHA